MKGVRFLNSRDVKKISAILERQWDVTLSKDYAYILTDKERLYMINRDVSLLDMDNVRIDSMGLYIGTFAGETFRLSLDGSFIFGPLATKDVVEVDETAAINWMEGKELEIDEKLRGPMIVKSERDYLGCGIAKNGVLLNHIPKERRINR